MPLPAEVTKIAKEERVPCYTPVDFVQGGSEIIGLRPASASAMHLIFERYLTAPISRFVVPWLAGWLALSGGCITASDH